MADFSFIQNKVTGKWVILAPRRAKRPDEEKNPDFCPFCPDQLNEEISYQEGEVKVIANKFPFAPIHEVIIHSDDHHKNFGELPEEKVVSIFRTYRQRLNYYKDKGLPYIFHNRGTEAGESLAHPHSQLVVIPDGVSLEIPPLESYYQNSQEMIQTNNFYIFCPEDSEWPDETWVSPKSSKFKVQSLKFGDITDEEINELAQIITNVIKILEKRLGKDFPYNFYIYPKENWYLRVIPRIKKLGGFEAGTKVFVNTEDPKETMKFLKENWQGRSDSN